MKEIKCVLVDDDVFMHQVIEDRCNESSHARLVAKFSCPEKFLNSLSELDFDICLLDIMMAPMDGFTVAKFLKGKPVIFITGGWGKIPEALDISPVDVLLKPITKERFESAMKKAYYILLGQKIDIASTEKKTHELFWVAELLGKVKVPLADIIYVKTDEVDYRNKVIYLSDGKKYTIMDHSLEELIRLAPQLIQVNRSEMISVSIFRDIEYDLITLNEPNTACMLPRQITLSRHFRKRFIQRVAYA